MRGLLNVVQEYTWELNGGSKMSVYLNAICLLSAMSQVCFPFYLLPFFSINGLHGVSPNIKNVVNAVYVGSILYLSSGSVCAETEQPKSESEYQ